MRPIGPKVQSQVPPETYEYIQHVMTEEERIEADVVRELIELGKSARARARMAGAR